MTAAQRKSSSSLTLLRDELKTLFRDLNELPGLRRASAAPPAVDVIETPDTIEIRLDLLDVAPDKLTVEIEGDTLAVRGARRIQAEEKAGHARVARNRVRHFSRRIQLPPDIHPIGIDARYKHGLLEITLQLRPKPR